ncbi:MAG: DEAD/DEAH box helicase [Acetobacter sp.]|jgi:ATP-dependent RNA helicase DeaD|nr:DEAD/DEAH box helicase [Acetobacter sp.]MCH4060597.1 DEAD/DEAH box helicase [Acetobacter sp.]MCH4087537.1 DEAD/DEAH box helicase [Acetobacter sp.]MCI1294933.1 DEAD/DEAH box helicase [Acetobacter sp.]MCI1321535.1 DEAD/DEAH box helicase [Acetobacter sp.]
MPFPDTYPALSSALAAKGYEEPTPVQDAVLQPETRGRDLLVSARTGSGKTVAFGLAMAPELLGEDGKLPLASTPLALVIAPTRELALQVKSELSWLYAGTGAKIVSCVGGMEPRREARALEMGCHIVVGTPGRLCDHLSRKTLKLSDLKVAVLDEADEMLDLGFREELETLLDATPETRRSFLFSATIAREIARLAKRYQKDALRIDTAGDNAPHADIEYRGIVADQSDTIGAVINTLRLIESQSAIVFCHTREAVRQLQSALMNHGFSSVAISGDLGQNERSRAIESLRSGQARVCVATDVAARGIDIPALGLVIHASLPGNPATLLHRSGRTGRAGRKGVCVILTTPSRRRQAVRLLEAAGVTAEWSSAPTPEAIRIADIERLMADPVLETPVSGDRTAIVERLLGAHSAEQVAAALIGLWENRLPEPVRVRAIAPGAVRERSPRERDREREPRRPREDDDRGPRQPRTAGAWFRLSVGRNDKADPKWLLPLLCRVGGVTKKDIGSIRIAPTHTMVEISADKAASFESCASATDADEVRIERAEGPGSAEAHSPRGRSPGTGRRREMRGGPPARKGGSSRRRQD